jgi:acyl transferase domain-containing protein
MEKQPIAIIGIGCRFPGAKNPEAFWQLLCEGIDTITEVPTERWDVESFYDSDPAAPDKMNSRWGGFLEHIDQFDPQFFGISPQEAASMDPQQRLLLEVAWEALEDAGKVPASLAKTRTGVFIGISNRDYSQFIFENPVTDPHGGIGISFAIAANRLSYLFDFTGPSLAVDTACSSSLVAVHLACQSIWNGESNLALVGGVQVILLPRLTASLVKGGLISPDGRCKTFDARANGYVRSEGAGVIVLKPLSQALSDRDLIYAVIRGSAVNQNGRSNGLTAPNLEAQKVVLREAYQQSAISPGLVQYIETQGTGTYLGDALEMMALGSVLSQDRPPGSYCSVGSVKTNIGHLEPAAGIAGLIKVALSLKHRQIPPHLHFQKPNPDIPWEKIPLRVQQTLTPWPERVNPALAGVSAFGFGGTNCHVVLEEAPAPEQRGTASEVERSLHLLTLSAKTEKALQDLAQCYEEFLTEHPGVSLADVCFTANTGRSHFNYRLAAIAESTEQLCQQLGAFAGGREATGLVKGKVTRRKSPKLAFVFPGTESFSIEMGQQLYQTKPTFRAAFDRCEEILHPYLDKPLLEVLESETLNSLPREPNFSTQAALFALEYALAELWKSWGINPSAVMGQGVGEYVAACVAEVFSLEEGLKLRVSEKRGGIQKML